VVARYSGCERLELAQRRGLRRAGREPADHLHGLAVVRVGVLAQLVRQPHAGERQRRDERRRHHTDDGVARAVDAKHLAERLASATEPAQPEAVTEHGDRSGTGPVLPGQERSPDRSVHAEHREQVGGDPSDIDAFGALAGQQVFFRVVERGNAVHGSRAGPGPHARPGASHSGLSRGPVGGPYVHEPAGVGERQRPEEERVHDREGRGQPRDAQCEDERRRCRRARPARGQPQADPRVGEALREMLARADAQESRERPRPQPGQRGWTVARRRPPFVVEVGGRRGAEVGAEIGREQPQPPPVPAVLPAHDSRLRARRRREWRASATSASSRSASARATSRPNAVRR